MSVPSVSEHTVLGSNGNTGRFPWFSLAGGLSWERDHLGRFSQRAGRRAPGHMQMHIALICSSSVFFDLIHSSQRIPPCTRGIAK
jgi:hypothetical protein